MRSRIGWRLLPAFFFNASGQGRILFDRDFKDRYYIRKLKPAENGAVAQLGERLNGIQEVRGSNPLSSTIKGYSLIFLHKLRHIPGLIFPMKNRRP